MSKSRSGPLHFGNIADVNRKVLAYELAGILFITILGSLLHFTYELSGGNLLVGAFSAVNESVWEHLKLAFFPAALFALIEYIPLRHAANNFWFGKTVGVYVMVGVIPAIFYSYTAFTGESIFTVDIASFIIGVIIGQLISYKLLTTRKLNVIVNWAAIFFLAILAALFVVFTYLPPQAPIFQEPISGQYGIPQVILIV